MIVLNPIGFVLLEIQNHRDREVENSSTEIKGEGSCMPLSIGLHVIKGVVTNPIVFMTVIGIIGNFVFHRNIPDVLSDILDVFGRYIMLMKCVQQLEQALAKISFTHNTNFGERSS